MNTAGAGLLIAVLVMLLAACGGNDGPTEVPTGPSFGIYDWEPNLIGDGKPYADREDAAALAEDNPGSIVVEAASQFYVLADEPAVTVGDVASAAAVTSRATGEPAVSAELTTEGKREFAALTRSVARRTSDQREALHFAIVVNGVVISLPIIDTEQNPRGISARNGLSIEGGLTESDAQELAASLTQG